VTPEKLKELVPGGLPGMPGSAKKPGAKPEPDSSTPAGVSTLGDVIGMVGIGVCTQKAKGANRGWCALGAVAAAEMTKQLGSKIADGLRENEQRKVLVAAADSLKTGEPSVVDLPESGTSVTVGPVGKETMKQVKIELLIDSVAVRDVPLMHVLGQTHEARGAQKLRNGPAANAASVGSLRAGETVHVIGAVEGGDSVLVSRWVTADGMAKPVGTGFVLASALQPSANKNFPADSDVVKSPPQMKAITVDAILKCQKLDFKKKDSAGNRVEDTSYLCVGPDGTTRSA
jgi:hypothetical protein